MSEDGRNLRFLNPPELAPPPGYTQVVEATGQRTIYVSGQISLNDSGEVVGPGDLQAQARQVFANIETALAAVGASFEDVVKLGIFLTDISRIGEVREARDRYVDTANPPASTAVEVSRLAREEFLIEVEAIAVA